MFDEGEAERHGAVVAATHPLIGHDGDLMKGTAMTRTWPHLHY